MFSLATAVCHALPKLPARSILFPTPLPSLFGSVRRNMATHVPGKTVEIPSKGPHTATVVWLHGLGDFGSGWYEPMEEMVISLPGVKVVLPTAPRRPVSINNGLVMTAWYDILGYKKKADEPFEGIEESSEFIRSLIKNEHDQGIPHDKILLGGFSQGGGLAIYTAVKHTPRLGGLCGLSTYMPRGVRLFDDFHLDVNKMPVFLGHGFDDTVVDMINMEYSRRWLEGMGFDVDARAYDKLGHEVGPAQMKSLTKFIAQCLAIQRVE